MNKKFMQILFLSVILSLFGNCLMASASNDKAILILISYHQGFTWSDDVIAGVMDELKDIVSNVQIYIEYMDTRRWYDDRQYEEKLFDIYKYKYRNHKFDLIISIDDNAYDFLLRNRDQLFQNVPVVFCGVNFFQDDQLIGKNNFTGVTETLDVKGTIELMIRVLPELKKIKIVSDKSSFGRMQTQLIKNDLVNYKKEIIQFEILDELSINDFNEEAKSLEEDSALLYVVIVKDRDGKSFNPSEHLSEISKNAVGPIFGVDENLLPFGIIGGSLKSGLVHGRETGKIAKQILEGKEVSQLPIIKKQEFILKLRYDLSKRFKIDISHLPEDIIVIGKPFSFYETYKQMVWLVSSTLILLLMLIAALAANIVRKKKTEVALRNSEEKYRTLFESSRDAIMTLAPPTWLFTSGNPATVELFRTRDEAEFISLGPWQLSPKRQPDGKPSDEKAKEMIETAMRNGSHFFEWTHCHSDGTPFPAEVLLTRMEQRGQVLLQATVRDITERKRMEEELLRAQKLESVGLLAGGIAHDFNNILTTILGNVSMARMQTKPGDEMFDLLSEAEKASKRAQTLTKQLLTFAKGGALLKETASIKDILKELSSFVLRGSKSSCEFSITEDLWPAEIDVGQISQVINNIVINANQAMPKGGTIQVAAENLIIEDKHGLPVKPGRYIRISIKDQGVGIAKGHLLNIFDPYFTTKQEGSGLGLATTYSIIKKHDGHIAVESQVGVDTTFHIFLPASDKIIPEKEEVKLITGQGRILVMDDEASLRKMVGRMLGNLGYESEFAKDGAEAIRMVQEAKEAGKPYDAVVLDLTIPGGMGGKKAIQKLLEIDPEVKAIVSSGYSDDPVLANFQEYGFKGMMPKPYESLSLGKVLDEVLKGEKSDC